METQAPHTDFFSNAAINELRGRARAQLPQEQQRHGARFTLSY
jgi:hypothetical protein